MNVFTQEWIEKARLYISSASPYRTIPFQYVLAIADQLAVLRDQIELWSEDFPIEVRKKLIGKLRARNADHTINELRVGARLRQLGYEISYEPDLFGQTPDWLATNSDASFVVEVFTATHSGVQKSIWENTTDLIGRLQEILHRYAVHVTASPSPEILTESINKRLTENVATWLSTQPSIGATRQWLNTEFQVTNWNPTYSKLQVSGPGHSWMVDKQFLRQTLEKKVGKYIDLANQQNIPLVVAVIPTFSSALGIDSLEDVLYGQEQVAYSVDGQGDLVGQPRLTRAWNDGLFMQQPHLSAVLWMREDRLNTGMMLIQNPNPVYPIDAKALPVEQVNS